jgi:2-iminobutanoate/2-iminopropanoate deaminase
VLELDPDTVSPLVLQTAMGPTLDAVGYKQLQWPSHGVNAPNPIGPYSQGIQVGKTVYLAGQGAIDPKSNQPMANASIEDQTRRTLDNLKAVLEADGLTMDHIVSTTVFLKDINEFGKMNEVYATYFKDAPPARATVEVARLPRDLKVEISAIAVRP